MRAFVSARASSDSELKPKLLDSASHAKTIGKYIRGLETQNTRKTNGAGRKKNTDQHNNSASKLTRTETKRLDETNVDNNYTLPQGRNTSNADHEAVTRQTGRKTAGVRQLGKHSTKLQRSTSDLNDFKADFDDDSASNLSCQCRVKASAGRQFYV